VFHSSASSSAQLPTRFEAFVHEHGQALVSFARRLTSDHHRGEDLVQEVLARCANRWTHIQDGPNPDGYVRKAIVREYLSWRRLRSSGEHIVADVPEPSRSAQAGFDDELAGRDQLVRVLSALPARQRVVLVLRYYEDLADEQIAAMLGCPTSTVRSLSRRALIQLRHNAPTTSARIQGSVTS
jgi:RNA polymerase sigma-70 factor (sigma-E family)